MDWKTIIFFGHTSNNFKRWLAKIILAIVFIGLMFRPETGMFSLDFMWFNFELLTTGHILAAFVALIIIWLHYKLRGL